MRMVLCCVQKLASTFFGSSEKPTLRMLNPLDSSVAGSRCARHAYFACMPHAAFTYARQRARYDLSRKFTSEIDQKGKGFFLWERLVPGS
jgi:hypothetical protein